MKECSSVKTNRTAHGKEVKMKFLRTVRNYILYCGIEKEEYKALKRDAYVSNFEVWRVLHCMMTFVFLVLFIFSLFVDIMAVNRVYYLSGLIYSIGGTCFFFALKKYSLAAQFIIYLSISLLLLFGAFLSSNNPNTPAVTFIAFIIITPMFMIDKPYFMAIELTAASTVFLIWMHAVKPLEIWRIDCGNIIPFTVVGIFIHIIANSIRIKEFVLRRKINIQKDTDELTGLHNKAALTRLINEYLEDGNKNSGIMLLLDFDRFKSINDNYGHDAGDSVIKQFGAFLGEQFGEGEITGRFGGDEFIVFVKDTNDPETAEKTAKRIVEGAAERVIIPDPDRKMSVSIGIALYHGEEKNYSEIFKKADLALYKTKSDRTVKYNFYNDTIIKDRK